MASSFKRSACVPLLLAGSLQLAACDQRPTLLRDLYGSENDCRNDWGGSEARCEQAPAPGGGSAWYGPQYLFGERQARTGGRDSRFAVQDVHRGDIVYGRSGPRVNSDGNASSGTHGASSVAGDTERRGFGSTGRSFSSSGG